MCKKKFTRTSNLTEHIKQQHQNEPESVRCPEHNCASGFKQMVNFVVHYKKKHLNKCGCKNNKGKLCFKCENGTNSAKMKWKIEKEKQITQQNTAKVEFLTALGLCCRQSCTQKKEVILGFKCLRSRSVTY